MPPLFRPAAFVPPPIPGDPVQILLVTSCIATATAILACALLWRTARRIDVLASDRSARCDPIDLDHPSTPADAMARGRRRQLARDAARRAYHAVLSGDPDASRPADAPPPRIAPEDRSARLIERARRQADRDATPPSPI